MVSPASQQPSTEPAAAEPREVDHLFGSGIIVAVGAVVQNARGALLLVKHVPDRRGYWRGKWICPGGRLTRGESVLAGAVREVWEETGLAIRPRKFLTPFERIVTVDGVPRLHVIYLDYLADVVGGELTPASDIGEAIWVDPADLPAVWPECHQDTQRLLTIAGFGPAPDGQVSAR